MADDDRPVATFTTSFRKTWREASPTPRDLPASPELTADGTVLTSRLPYAPSRPVAPGRPHPPA
ncbi:MAG TPA: hypothetical protein VMW49_04445 [Candidatus Dormibacteraeota bacterium]|nr:hypothetical protein [Candidatus Dormibacteraeota bacterium]